MSSKSEAARKWKEAMNFHKSPVQRRKNLKESLEASNKLEAEKQKKKAK